MSFPNAFQRLSKNKLQISIHEFAGVTVLDIQGRATIGVGSRGAEILGTLNAVHPFREGNGTQREFVREFAHKNSYWVDCTKVSRGELYKQVT